MVSLQPNRRLNMSTGAQYMDEVLGDSQSASHIISDVEPILATDNGHFKKLNTIPAFSIHLCISVIISVVAIAFRTTLWPEDKRNEAYFILMTLRAAFWIITNILDNFVRKRHNDLRMNGFHDFHRSIVKHNGVGITIVSAWNTLMLLTQATLRFKYNSESDELSAWDYVMAINLAYQVLESLIFMITHGIYIAAVYKFNKNEQNPDALMGTHTSAAGSLGLMQPGGNVAELLEKQADLISYLKDHNQNLNQKLHQMQLNTRVSHLGH